MDLGPPGSTARAWSAGASTLGLPLGPHPGPEVTQVSLLLPLIGGERRKPAGIGPRSPTSRGPGHSQDGTARRLTGGSAGSGGRRLEPAERGRQDPSLRGWPTCLSPAPFRPAATTASPCRAGPRAGAQVNVAQPQAEPAPARLPAVRPKWQPRGRWTLGSCTAPHTKFNRQPAPGPPPDLRTAALQPLCQEKGGPSGHWADPVSAQQGTGGEASSSHPCPPAPAGVQSYRHGHELAVPSALPLETP